MMPIHDTGAWCNMYSYQFSFSRLSFERGANSRFAPPRSQRGGYGEREKDGFPVGPVDACRVVAPAALRTPIFRTSDTDIYPVSIVALCLYLGWYRHGTG